MEFLKTLNGSKQSAESLIASGDSYRDARNWLAAAEHYRAALDVDSRLAHIWVQYGHALKETRQLEAAEEAYHRALSIEDLADTHLQLGHLHKIMGHRRQAESDYLRALERQPGFADARAELGRFGWNSSRLRGRLSKPTAALSQSQAFVAIELSDLIDHLQHAHYPTGIQRVQLALAAALAGSPDKHRIQFVYYDHMQSDFFEVQPQQVLDLLDLIDNRREDDVRRSIADRLKTDIVQAIPFEFPHGSYLVNVGTSWGFLNYFLSLREIKRRNNVRYVPLVHDCIPILYPEFCNPDLVTDFINWISHMIGHADLVLTNSENTKRDVIKVADELGELLPPVATVRLNGEYRDHLPDTDAECDSATEAVFSINHLDVEDFVLLVSTIEPRKNHGLALNAWSRMLKTRPANKVPLLVCVGGSGWMNESFHQRLERDKLLRSRIVVLQDVSDQALQTLYNRCLFTIFPSLYEGWGLPISEALAHGKVPLVSRVSSHPEAGGDLAVYFDLSSEADFQSKLEDLIDNVEVRRSRESKIRAAPSLRSWSDIGSEILATVDRHLAGAKTARKSDSLPSPAITSGKYYMFARNRAPDLRSLLYSGDVYRAGTAWYPPEPFGCWIRGRSADLAFSTAAEGGSDFIIYLHWMGSANTDNEVTISLLGSQWSKTVSVKAGQSRWDAIPAHFMPQSKREVRIRIAAKFTDDLNIATKGQDNRLVSVAAKGLYVCAEADSQQRMAIIEAIQLGDLETLARRLRLSSTI
jgi:glycosyltransferase involved in cell wall biosynthesis